MQCLHYKTGGLCTCAPQAIIIRAPFTFVTDNTSNKKTAGFYSCSDVSLPQVNFSRAQDKQ